MKILYGVGLLDFRPTPSLEDYPMSAVHVYFMYSHVYSTSGGLRLHAQHRGATFCGYIEPN